MTFHNIRPELMDQAVDITLIRPNPANPNMGDVDEIRASLRKFGQFRPVNIDLRTGYLIEGHHTYYAAVEEGWTLIAAGTITTVDDAEAMGILLASNGTARRSRDDEGLLLAALQSVPDLSGTGYEQGHVRRLERLLERPLDLSPAVVDGCPLCGK